MTGDADGEEAWFVYTRTAGRITALPANWKGWAAFIAAVAANILAAYAVMAVTADIQPLARLVLLMMAIGGKSGFSLGSPWRRAGRRSEVTPVKLKGAFRRFAKCGGVLSFAVFEQSRGDEEDFGSKRSRRRCRAISTGKS